MKRFKTPGIWFLPSDSENRLTGTLRFSPRDGIFLTLAGSFQPGWTFKTPIYERIRGVVSESPYGEFVSLFQCYETSISLGMSGLSLETIRSHHGFVGGAFVESEDCLFDEATVYFPPLARWLFTRDEPIIEASPSPGIIARWNKRSPLQAQLSEGRISTAAKITNSIGSSPPSVTFTQTPSLLVQCKSPSTADQIHQQFVGPLGWLMTFAADEPTGLDRYTLHTVGQGESDITTFDRIYSPVESATGARTKRRKGWDNLLFSGAEVPGGFASFMPTWFSFVRSYPEFCAMFFSQCYQRRGYVESRFLFRMLTAQILARELYKNDVVWTRMTMTHASNLASTCFSSEPFPGLSMPTVTQMVTPTLVSKLFSEHWSVIKGIVGTNNDRLINTLFHTLDYVSNRTPPSDDAVVEGAALAWLIERVSAAIKLIMLKQLGFDEDKLINIISTRPRFIQLKTIKEPWGVT